MSIEFYARVMTIEEQCMYDITEEPGFSNEYKDAILERLKQLGFVKMLDEELNEAGYYDYIGEFVMEKE